MVGFLMEMVGLFIDNLRDWPLGTFLGILNLGLVLFIGLVVVSGLFVAVDYCCGSTCRGVGRVIKKTFAAAHVEYYLIGGRVPARRNVDDKWSVRVEINAEQVDISVSEKLYTLLSEGTPVRAKYVLGRFSGSPYLKAICWRKQR